MSKTAPAGPLLRAGYSVLVMLLTITSCFSNEGTSPAILKLVASGVPDIRGWCGDRSVYFNGLAKGALNLTLLNIDNGREKILDAGGGLILNACSPDGRCVVTEEGADWRYDHGADADECDAPKPLELPKVTLWDTLNDSRYAVGEGILNVNWSPDGKMLLYQFVPECGLDRDPRNSFHLPTEVSEFAALAVFDLVPQVTNSSAGLAEHVAVAAASWVGNDRFIVQFSDGKALDPFGFGAVVVRLDRHLATDIRQLNPRGFESSWVLALPQMKSQESPDLLSAANCKVGGYRDTHVLCSGNRANERTVHLDIARYCGKAATTVMIEFCRPAQRFVRWSVIRHGGGVLLLRRLDQTPGKDLFWIENENGDLK